MTKPLTEFTKQWATYVTSVLAQEKLHDWSKLWDDFTRKEIWEKYFSSRQHKSGDDENLTLASQASRSKGKSLRLE